MDFSIFEHDDTSSDYAKCGAIKRLLACLNYYARLDIETNENDKEIFASFVETIYPINKLLNDSNHAMLSHNEQLQQIYDELIGGDNKCKMNKCQATQRHFAETKVQKSDDEKFDFYITLLDSLHFYFYHIFDCGYRVKAEEEIEKEEEEQKQDENEYFDKELARLNKAIRQRDALTASFERISPQNNSKFNILNKTKQGDTTYCDEMYKHLKDEGIATATIQKLKALLESELFDTDSVKMDVDTQKYQNIEKLLDNQKCYDSMQRFVKSIAGLFTF